MLARARVLPHARGHGRTIGIAAARGHLSPPLLEPLDPVRGRDRVRVDRTPSERESTDARRKGSRSASTPARARRLGLRWRADLGYNLRPAFRREAKPSSAKEVTEDRFSWPKHARRTWVRLADAPSRARWVWVRARAASSRRRSAASRRRRTRNEKASPFLLRSGAEPRLSGRPSPGRSARSSSHVRSRGARLSSRLRQRL